MNLILASIGVFLGIILLLVVILLVAKQYLTPSGKVKITINGEKELEVEQGSTLLNTLSVNGIYLSSACGGKGSCGQCKCQVVEGGGEILPSEKGHFSRKQQQDHWRLGCQVKVKGDLGIKIDESVLGVKEWECEVISNKNVATFIKEFIVALPKGEHMDFVPGSYAQIKIPKFEMDYNKDIDKDLIGPEYLPAWEKFGLFGLKCKNTEETIRAYSMANYPCLLYTSQTGEGESAGQCGYLLRRFRLSRCGVRAAGTSYAFPGEIPATGGAWAEEVGRQGVLYADRQCGSVPHLRSARPEP